MNKQLLFTFSIVFSCLFYSGAYAQVIDGYPMDSALVYFAGDSIPNFIPDTAAVPLWQIGHSYKTFFGIDSSGTTTIMTDTSAVYPVNANNSFVIVLPGYQYNVIIDFWHKYQTDSTHAGGVVEFSLDRGVSWQNVKGYCNVDGGFFGGVGVLTSDFYSFNDTLASGEPSFNGTQDSTVFSRFQFFDGFPVRTTSDSTCDLTADTMFIRFRFISDTTIDSLAGWIIDSIKIEYDFYPGSVARVVKPTISVFPNPSYDGAFHFPALYNEAAYKTEVYNMLGERVLSIPYCHEINIAQYPAGLYLYKVTNGVDYYTGQLLMEH